MTPAQLQILKTFILSTPALAAKPMTSAGAAEIAVALNLDASPSFWVWRTNVQRKELYHTTSVDGTTWNWTTYKGQTQGEQGAWTQMFMGDQADFSLANLRAAVSNIFGAGNAQTTHCLTVGRRLATVVEKLLAVGTGSTASPAVMGFEGAISSDLVQQVRES